MARLNRNVATRLSRFAALLLILTAVHLFAVQQSSVQAQTRPTLDPSRQPLTALPIATLRAGLTATAAAPAPTLTATATIAPPTPTVAASTPALPNLGSGKSGPNYGLLLGGVIIFWLIGLGILRFATQRRR